MNSFHHTYAAVDAADNGIRVLEVLSNNLLYS